MRALLKAAAVGNCAGSMARQLQYENSAEPDKAARPVEFAAICAVAFVASIAATAYFCRSMCCEVEMPGGWTISTMWMRMPGQTWFASAVSFQLMWLGMMVAMMLPSALPTFLKPNAIPLRCL